ncbi:Xaa-Pro dipeptidase [Nymphaea thermarum]|nr:Xaa-Pro dipeptidase [Nymphaea thermarum]
MASMHGPPEVAMELHALNRAKLVHSFRQKLKACSRPLYGFILLQGGTEQTRYCSDHVILFRQESYFAYLFGVREPGFYGAIDVSTGKSFLFAPRLTDEYAVWLGKIKPLSAYKERYMVSSVCYADEIGPVLKNHYRGPGKPMLYLLYGLNTDSNQFSKPAEFEGIVDFQTDLDTLHPILSEGRVFKSELELSLIKYANEISSTAHIEVMQKTKAGLKEYQLEMIFLHHIYMHGGCRHCAYTCICATGENSAIIHYGHAAAPNDQTIEDGDMALMDMGAEYHFYASDISCSFPVSNHDPSFSPWCLVSSTTYAVLKAHDAVISVLKPGLNLIDMHKLAEKQILEALKAGSVLTGEVDDMMEARLGAIFMPHGAGHFLGIDAHDPGGYPKVIALQPGCYFNDALLNPALQKPDLSKFINQDVIARFKKFGGVRIESNVHITSNGCENFTDVPRQTWEIEAVMAGSSWPLDSETIQKYQSNVAVNTSASAEANAATETTTEDGTSSSSAITTEDGTSGSLATATENGTTISSATTTAVDSAQQRALTT